MMDNSAKNPKQCFIVTNAEAGEIEGIVANLSKEHGIPKENLKMITFRKADKHEQAAFLPKIMFSDVDITFVGWGQILPFLKGRRIYGISLLDYQTQE